MKLFAAVSFLALAATGSAFAPRSIGMSHNTAALAMSTVATEEDVKIYVGNLSWDTDPDMLGDVFSEFGEVTDVFLPVFPDSGNRRGFGFVTMTGRENAEAAIDAMDGMELDGRDIRCNESTQKPRANNRSFNRDPPGPFNEAGNAEVRLYVGNLSFGSTEDSLRDAFEEFGEVKDVIIPTDRETGDSRGFAFVTMAAAEAEAALALDGADIDGRYVRVNESLPKPERTPRRSREPAGPFNEAGAAEVKLYVGNLSYDSTEGSVREAFGEFGEVTDCFVPTDRDTGKARGFAFVTMAAAEAESALALDGTQIDGRYVKVNESLPKPPRDEE